MAYKEALSNSQGEHICLICGNEPADQVRALTTFIKEGLAGDEQCIYISDDKAIDGIRHLLKAEGVDVGSERERASLLLGTRKEWRRGNPETGDGTDQILKIIDAALNAGFKGVRFCIEIASAIEPDVSLQRLRQWETAIDSMVAHRPIKMVCQYNRDHFSPAVIKEALTRHPSALLDHRAYPNFFYESPAAIKTHWRFPHICPRPTGITRLTASRYVCCC